MGSGRKALDPFDELTLFCADALGRLLLFDPDVTRSRMKRELKHSTPDDLGPHEELDELYSELRAVPVSERAALIAATGRDKGTPLDDIRHVIGEELGGRRLVSLPPASSIEIGLIYEKIAAQASKAFGKKITARQVKRRIALHYGPL